MLKSRRGLTNLVTKCNLLFQSAGAIACKYSVLYMCQKLEEQGYLGDPLEHGENDLKVYLMIVYHDEIQLAISKNLIEVFKFNSENVPEEFKIKSKEQHEAISKDLLEISNNPFVNSSDVESLENKLKNLPSPAELAAEAKKEELQSDCYIGHVDDYYYVTNNNIAIDAFKYGISLATQELKIKVALTIAWNSGNNWAETH